MRPRRKLLKSIKWCALVVAFLWIGLWCSSLRWGAIRHYSDGWRIHLLRGEAGVRWPTSAEPPFKPDITYYDWMKPNRPRPIPSISWWRFNIAPAGFSEFRVPLWIPATSAILVSLLAWRFDRRARFRDAAPPPTDNPTS